MTSGRVFTVRGSSRYRGPEKPEAWFLGDGSKGSQLTYRNCEYPMYTFALVLIVFLLRVGDEHVIIGRSYMGP